MRLALLAFLALALAGCGKSDPPEASDPDVPAHATNPDGVPYPTDHIGTTPRSGKNPGDRIANLTFQAYVDGDKSALKTVSLADWYDPTAKKWKVMHIEAAATWCAICGSVADATVITRPAFEPKGIAYLEVVAAGPSAGFGPSLDDVSSWIDAHHSNFTTAIDVRGRRLAAYGVTKDTFPYDIYLDLRTMEILESSAGTAPDIGIYDQKILQEVVARPPAY